MQIFINQKEISLGMTKRGSAEAIFKLIKDSPRPVSTREIASRLKIAWHTADRYCLKLKIQNKVDYFTIGKATAWFRRGERG